MSDTGTRLIQGVFVLHCTKHTQYQKQPSYRSTMLLNSGHGVAMAKWRGGYFDNCHKQFVKGCPPRCRLRPEWRVYIADY